MKKYYPYILLFVLLLSQVYLINRNLQLKDANGLKNSVLDRIMIQYSAVESQFALNVQNVGKKIKITEGLEANAVISADSIRKSGSAILLCRFSGLYCEQCVNHAIRVITDSVGAFDLSKIIFVAGDNSRRVLNLQIREYGLQNCNVVNCGDLGIPAEKVMFPYYAVIDSNLTIISTYFPNKSTHGTDFDFKNVKLMYENLVK